MKYFKRILNKYNDMAKPAKASLWFIGCYIIQRGLQFIGMPIYTRIMSTEEYGVYSVFLSWFNLLCVFSSLNIYAGTFNKAMIKYEKDRDRYISAVQSLTLLVSLVVSAFILLFHVIIQDVTGFSLKLLLLFCIHLILYPPLQYWSQKQRFLFEYKKLVFVTLINSVASLVIGILLVILSTNKSNALIIATVGVQAIVNIVLFYSLAKKGKTVYHKEYWLWSLSTSVPLIPHYLAEILLGHADRLMINQMCGASQAGIYNIVYQISMVMTIIRTGINGSFTPWLYYSLKQKKYDDIKRVTKIITLLMSTMTIVIMLVGPEILKIAAPSSYYEAVIDIPSIMLGGFFIFIYVLFVNVEIYYEQNQFVAIVSIISAIVNVVLNYIYINQYGYLAAGYTTMISYLLMAIMHYWFLQRLSNKHKEIKMLFDYKFLFLISAGLVIIGLMALFLYDFTIIRWILICIVCTILFTKKNMILQFIRLLRNK